MASAVESPKPSDPGSAGVLADGPVATDQVLATGSAFQPTVPSATRDEKANQAVGTSAGEARPLEQTRPESSTPATVNLPAGTPQGQNQSGIGDAARPALANPPAGPHLPEPNPFDRAVAQQVSRAVMRPMAGGGEHLIIRLTPGELGTVRIELIQRDGVLHAAIHAEDDGVRQALERALPLLRQDLKAFDVGQVTMTSDKQEARDQQQNQQQPGHQQSHGQHQPGQPNTWADGRRSDDQPLFSLDAPMPESPQRPLPAPVRPRILTANQVDLVA